MADITASPLVSCLQQLEDPRIERAKRHELLDLLLLCVLATICGADSMVAIEEFGESAAEMAAHSSGLAAWDSCPRYGGAGAGPAGCGPV